MGKQDSLADFHNYSFDGDAKFKEYLCRFEVTDPKAENRLKAKYYKQHIDPNFDPAWANEAKPTTGPSSRSSNFFNSTPPPSSGAQQQSQSNTQSSSHSSAPPRGGASASSGPASKLIHPLRLIFLYHVAILVLATVYLLPIAPRPWSRSSYRLLMQLSLIGQGCKLYLRFGLPTFKPLESLQLYLTRVVPTNDFYILVLSFSFMSHSPMTLVLVPLTIQCVYGAVSYLASNYGQNPLWQKMGQPAHMTLQRQTTQAQTLSAMSELLVGLFLVGNLLTPKRNVLLTFAFWNLLKMRYHASEANVYHQKIWSIVSTKIAPILAAVPGPLRKGIDFVVNWFLTPR